MKFCASLALLFLCGVLGTPLPAPAQEVQEEQEVDEAVALPGPVGALQTATRVRALTDSVSRAVRVIEGLQGIEGLVADVEDAERSFQDLQGLLASVIDADFVRTERLSRLQDHASIEDGRLDDLQGRLSDRITRLEEVDARWMASRQLWASWLEAHRSEPGNDAAEIEAEMLGALRLIEGVRDSASAAASPSLALQRRVEALRGEIALFGERVARIQTRRAEARFERSGPLLFSAAHRAQLQEGGWRAWDPTAEIQPAAYLAFAGKSWGLLVFHTLLVLLVGGAVRMLRSATPREEGREWSGLLDHPWALGVLVSVVIAMARVTLAPPLWDVVLWCLLGASATILARRAIDARALRLTVYLVSVFYPTFLLLEVLRLPDPVFRVGLAAVAACAIPLFLVLARDKGSTPGTDSDSDSDTDSDSDSDTDSDSDSDTARARALRIWPLLLGAGVWIGVLVALVTGFDALARWTLHATAMSAAVAFVATLGFVLLRGADAALSRLGTEGPFVRRAGLLLAQRASRIVRFVLLGIAGLVLLDIWGVSGSPITTWQRVMDAGFTVGSFPVSVGRILLGAFIVYLTVAVSGLVRSLATTGLDGRPSGEEGERPIHAGRGLADSITKLGQYAVVTLGVILALAVVGVKLQNFAIIAGALGIGVGFGLQNVVNNFASGLILLFERPVRVGDTVVVGDTWGTIQKIGLRSTRMLTLDESEMIVPNADLVSEKVINWTLTSPIARVFLPVGVAYGSPVAEVQEILREAAFAHPSVLKEPPPQALFMAFGDSSLDFELRLWVRDIRLRMEMRSAVLADIDQRLRDAGIQIPFPQRDLHLRSVDDNALTQLGERDADEE
ncbi:MAG: mechanosensitive ion channel [Longimicrobiales bacterium]|nr:mechanosensitive ion channel [Longimicrobiales bacterium]